MPMPNRYKSRPIPRRNPYRELAARGANSGPRDLGAASSLPPAGKFPARADATTLPGPAKPSIAPQDLVAAIRRRGPPRPPNPDAEEARAIREHLMALRGPPMAGVGPSLMVPMPPGQPAMPMPSPMMARPPMAGPPMPPFPRRK